MRAMNAHMGGVPNQNPPTTAPGVQHVPITNMRGAPGTSTPGRTASPSPFQPEGTRTTVRESTGPNGLQYRVTINETFVNPLQRPGRTASPFATPDAANPWAPPPRSVPNAGQVNHDDMHNIFRSADAGSAIRVMTDAMRRNASSSSLASLAASQGQAHHPIPPGVTTPLIPSRAGSAAGTPDPLRALGRTRSPPANQTQAQSQSQPSQNTPEVYILSSPSGPRALLLNSSTSDSYFTPPARSANQPTGMSFAPRPFPALANPFSPQHVTPTPTVHRRLSPLGPPNARQNGTPQPQQPQAQPPQGLPQPPQGQPQIGHAVARPDNPQVQAIRLAQIWPHISMLIRLGLFIWWFTSPSSSWSRWFTVLSIAVTLFLVNTGLLNPLVDQFWVPFRRHLDNLIPLPHDHGHGPQPPVGAGNAQARNGETAAEPGQQTEPNPADAAARLVQQRRHANANWLMNQARRLERAGILFLASIAPGVAERHIQAERERIRREAEAAAVVLAAAQAENEQSNENNENNENGTPTSPAAEAAGEQAPVEGEGERAREVNDEIRAEEPLIAV